MAFSYLQAVLGSMIVKYVIETYLDIRQRAAHKLPALPKQLIGVVSKEKFERSRTYSLDKSCVHFAREATNILMHTAILYFKILPWFWQKSGDFALYMGLDAENEIINGIINEIIQAFSFLAGCMLWSQLADLPFSLYSTFAIEAHHGSNKQTVWLFFRDMFKNFLLSLLAGLPAVAVLIIIFQKGGPFLMFMLSIVMTALDLVLIAPLFNKFTPLPEGELREKIEELAASLKFPLKKLFVVAGSTRSSHSNAYIYGFFNNKQIVLYDTLIQQCKNEEVVAVIAQELGHWTLNHTIYTFISIQIPTLLQFGGYALARNSKDFFWSFGFETQPMLLGLIIFQYAAIALQRLVRLGLNLVSRAFEFEADAFATKLGHGKELRAALVKLQEENLSAMTTDPWYSAYHYSHPPLVERLGALDVLCKKKKNK